MRERHCGVTAVAGAVALLTAASLLLSWLPQAPSSLDPHHFRGNNYSPGGDSRADASTPPHGHEAGQPPDGRVLVVTIWTVTTDPRSVTACQRAFDGASGFIRNALAQQPGTDLLLLHNTACDVQAQFGSGLSSIRNSLGRRFHIYDERWLWYRKVVDAVQIANERGNRPVWPWQGAVGPLWHVGSGPAGHVSGPAISHVLLMDARDTILLTPPGPFFSTMTQYDLFIGEEATDNSIPWMVRRYETCQIDPTALGFVQHKVLNAGVVGGIMSGMSWLIDRVIEELHQAEARAGLPCTSLGIDMVLVNTALRLNATASGMATWTGEPFTPTYKHGTYVVYANYSSSLGIRGGLPAPEGLYTPEACGCVYPGPGGAAGRYHDTWTEDDERMAVRCSVCVPYLAMHKVRPVFRE